MSADQILKAALSLSSNDRAMLAEELLASLDASDEVAIDPAYLKEIESRIDAYDSGRTTSRPAEDVIRDIRERLR